MSYLNLPELDLADISMGTISLWFRFSQDSVDAVQKYSASYKAPDTGGGVKGPDIFKDTIPLVTFGRKVMAHTYGSVGHLWTQTEGGILFQTTTFDYVQQADSPCEPSHLGLEVRNEASGISGVTLKMVFQTETRAVVQGLFHQATDIYWVLTPSGATATWQEYQTVKDISFIATGQPESFLIRPTFAIDQDLWHHLLVSFDFSQSVEVVALKVIGDAEAPDTEAKVRNATIKSFCKLSYAFDDENKKGINNIGNVDGFGQRTTGWVPRDENGIIPQNAEGAILAYYPATPDPSVTGGNENPEYHWTASPLPTSLGPVGIPASDGYVDTIYHCEMAEFQMWADIALDTADETIRRAFIDFERDGEGNIIGPPKPVNPQRAVELLGRRPDILLHGSSNWQEGNNTGSAEGQFIRTGGIAKYKPEPALGT